MNLVGYNTQALLDSPTTLLHPFKIITKLLLLLYLSPLMSCAMCLMPVKKHQVGRSKPISDYCNANDVILKYFSFDRVVPLFFSL